MSVVSTSLAGGNDERGTTPTRGASSRTTRATAIPRAGSAVASNNARAGGRARVPVLSPAISDCTGQHHTRRVARPSCARPKPDRYYDDGL